MHRHFRMIRIHNDMRSNGIATEDAPHTRIPGIWRKLETLYALEDLNTREDEHAFGDERPYIREEAVNIPDFELPEEEYGEMMWQRRFADDSDAPSSPPMFPVKDEKTLYTPGVGLLKDLPGSARYKAETPAEATPTPKNAKTTKGTKAASKSGKGAKAAAANAKNAKARSTVSESAEEDDEEDEEEETTPESEEESAPATRRAGRGRVRQPPKRTRKR
jgi:MRG-binding protein